MTWQGSGMRDGVKRVLLALLLVLMLAVTVISLDRYGRSVRTYKPVSAANDARFAPVFVDRPMEAYRLWKKQGMRGRIVVSFSRWLNFVESGKEADKGSRKGIVRSRDDESSLTDMNFMFVAMKTAIAREIIHVVPESVYYDKAKYVRDLKGVTAGKNEIVSNYQGASRTITMVEFIRPVTEPVLLYINASYFRDYEPEYLVELIRKADLIADSMILCNSTDDNEVSPREREKLQIFSELIKGVRRF